MVNADSDEGERSSERSDGCRSVSFHLDTHGYSLCYSRLCTCTKMMTADTKNVLNGSVRRRVAAQLVGDELSRLAALSFQQHEQLVEKPRVALPATPAPQPSSVLEPEGRASLPDRLVRDRDSAPGGCLRRWRRWRTGVCGRRPSSCPMRSARRRIATPSTGGSCTRAFGTKNAAPPSVARGRNDGPPRWSAYCAASGIGSSCSRLRQAVQHERQ